jgi:enoyl-CoA hydratase
MTEPLSLSWGSGGDAAVCTVTLNRPGAGNALSAELVAALESRLDEAAARQARLLVLRGEGRHFCTGFDLSRLDDESDDSLLARFCRIELMLQKLHRAPFETLAIAHGRTVGAGADLFVACTHRLAAPGTQLAFPGASGFGLVLGTRRLAHRVGAERARRWVETGVAIGLDEALAAGLATGTPGDASGAENIARGLAAAALAAPASVAAASSDPAAVASPPAAGKPFLDAALSASDPVHDHADLALLVRSAAVPGLKARIAAYVERGRQQRSAPSSSPSAS